jgi:hypothetical protein
MLARHGGASFRTALDQNLSHLEIALTSFGGVGVATFYAHGNIAASHAFCTGGNRTAEDEVLRMFVDSLRRVDVVRKAQVTERPFEAALTIEERPLWVVVAWGNPAVSAQDEQLIRELGVHFAAAFLTDAEKGANKQIHHIPKR